MPDEDSHGASVSPERGLGASLRHVHRQYIRVLQEHLSTRGITVAQYLHLRVLWEEEGLPQNEISSRLGIEKASSTSVLESLDQRGLVVRTRDSADRRKVRVHLSEKGKALGDSLLPFAREVALMAARNISEHDLAIFYDVIAKINVNLSGAQATESTGDAPGRRSRLAASPGAARGPLPPRF